MLQQQRHSNLGVCAGFALANCDWLGRTIAFYQVFFQQGRVALGKWCIGPQKGHPRTPGMDFFVQCPGPIFLAARWSGPARWHVVSPTLYIIIVYRVSLNKLSRNFVGALRTTTTNCRVSFIDLYLLFSRNFKIAFSPHTNTVILLERYCSTITEPGLPVIGLSRLSSATSVVWSKFLRF